VLGTGAIQAFSVVTGIASADYGKTSGGVINAVTRSGTNDFHGSVCEFLRNSAFDARNFFDGAQVPPFNSSAISSEPPSADPFGIIEPSSFSTTRAYDKTSVPRRSPAAQDAEARG
jgi:hypothetical protein